MTSGLCPRELARQGFVEERPNDLWGEPFGVKVFNVYVRVWHFSLEYIQHPCHDTVCPAEALVIGVDNQDILWRFGGFDGVRYGYCGKEGQGKYGNPWVQHTHPRGQFWILQNFS